MEARQNALLFLTWGNLGNFSKSGLLQSTSLCLPDGCPFGKRYIVSHWFGCAMIHRLTPEIIATILRLPSKWASAITCIGKTVGKVDSLCELQGRFGMQIFGDKAPLAVARHEDVLAGTRNDVLVLLRHSGRFSVLRRSRREKQRGSEHIFP